MPNLDQKRRATAFSVQVAVIAIPTAASGGHHLLTSRGERGNLVADYILDRHHLEKRNINCGVFFGSC
jgi:hypothetical protein